MIIDFDGTGWHFVQALVDDAEGFPELLNATEVPIVAVSILSNGNVKLDLA